MIFNYVKKGRKKPFLSFELFKGFGNAILYLKEGGAYSKFSRYVTVSFQKNRTEDLLVTRSYLVRNIVQTLFDMKKIKSLMNLNIFTFMNMQTFQHQAVHKKLFICSFEWDVILYENHNLKIHVVLKIACSLLFNKKKIQRSESGVKTLCWYNCVMTASRFSALEFLMII